MSTVCLPQQQNLFAAIDVGTITTSVMPEQHKESLPRIDQQQVSVGNNLQTNPQLQHQRLINKGLPFLQHVMLSELPLLRCTSIHWSMSQNPDIKTQSYFDWGNPDNLRTLKTWTISIQPWLIYQREKRFNFFTIPKVKEVNQYTITTKISRTINKELLSQSNPINLKDVQAH